MPDPTPIPAHHRQPPIHPTALLYTVEWGAALELDPQDPMASIRSRVADGGVNRIQYLDDITFWVGDMSTARQPFNAGVTGLLTVLLTAAATGAYPVSPREREEAHRLLANPAHLEVYGPCVVTGANSDGHPIDLPSQFSAWAEAALAEDRAQAAVDHAVEILTALGANADRAGITGL